MAPRKFSTEAEMCDIFAETCRDIGLWDVYPEIDGFDLVLVWRGIRLTNSDDARVDALRASSMSPWTLPAGHQIGIDAKLRPSLDLLCQAVNRRAIRRAGIGTAPQPDEHAVLVPEVSPAFRVVATELRFRVLVAQGKHGDGPYAPHPRLDCVSPRRLLLPPVPLAGPGGLAAPRTMSAWRVGALRLCAILRERPLTGADFKTHGVGASRWVAMRWVTSDGKRPCTYVAGPKYATSGPVVGYEKEFAALVAHDAEEKS